MKYGEMLTLLTKTHLRACCHKAGPETVHQGGVYFLSLLVSAVIPEKMTHTFPQSFGNSLGRLENRPGFICKHFNLRFIL